MHPLSSSISCAKRCLLDLNTDNRGFSAVPRTCFLTLIFRRVLRAFLCFISLYHIFAYPKLMHVLPFAALPAFLRTNSFHSESLFLYKAQAVFIARTVAANCPTRCLSMPVIIIETLFSTTTLTPLGMRTFVGWEKPNCRSNDLSLNCCAISDADQGESNFKSLRHSNDHIIDDRSIQSIISIRAYSRSHLLRQISVSLPFLIRFPGMTGCE